MSQRDQPNVLLIVSDEERRNDWLRGYVDLPSHDRLRSDGLEFSRHYTHSSPCSPSRASLYTGQYLPQHGVVDNVSFPAHKALDPAIPTIGSLMRDEGYESAYLGKWHISHEERPPMESHGYSGWQGNDMHFVGGAWTGRYFDPEIVSHAIDWLENRPTDKPWFLTVALVNPHDVMWYPIDQPSYQAEHPRDRKAFEFIKEMRTSGLPLVPPSEDYPRLFDSLPENFGDDLHTKPEIQRAWRHVRNSEHFVGSMDLADTNAWLRQLDYYAYLHQELDSSLDTLLGGLDRLGIYDDTTIVYTSDHGDACGSHGLRAKLPCVYEEVMGVPLIIKAPGQTTPGSTTEALGTHVDLAATIASLGGVDVSSAPSLAGKDLGPVLVDPSASVRDHVLFAQDSAQSEHLRSVRYAVRGFFDGETKYARYYGVGGGIQRDGTVDEGGKTFDVDADFDDHDHEWYEMGDDPHELVNHAHDRGRRADLRENFGRLLEYEAAEFGFLG
jgi:arylsulfatase A-like enzyme